MNHCQSSSGDTEHHAREESGHVHTKAPGNSFRRGRIASPEVGQIAQSNGIEPEHVIQRMMQSCRNEQTVQEYIDTCSYSIQANDRISEADQGAENNRPYEQQDCRCNDGHAALA